MTHLVKPCPSVCCSVITSSSININAGCVLKEGTGASVVLPRSTNVMLLHNASLSLHHPAAPDSGIATFVPFRVRFMPDMDCLWQTRNNYIRQRHYLTLAGSTRTSSVLHCMTAGAGHPTRWFNALALISQHVCMHALLADFKILIKQKFDARTSYDKDNERHPTLAAQLVKRSNLRLGWQVLDLACGSGLVTYPAAADVGSAGFVTGMDLSTGLLQQAEAKRASSGLNNIEFLAGDIEHADFPSKSFDAILCSSAIFYFDMPSTTTRLKTWLKPGGLLAYNTLQAPFTPLLTLLHQLLEEQGCSNPQPPFSQMPDDAAHVEVLQRANFTNVKVEATPGLLLEKPTPLDTYVDKGWQMVATGFKPFFPSLADMSTSEQAALKEQFYAQATVIGKGMINQQGLVEDRHINLWITAIATV